MVLFFSNTNLISIVTRRLAYFLELIFIHLNGNTFEQKIIQLPAQAGSLIDGMQLADRIAIPALVVASIGVMATLYGAYTRIRTASESFLRRLNDRFY